MERCNNWTRYQWYYKSVETMDYWLSEEDGENNGALDEYRQMGIQYMLRWGEQCMTDTTTK